MKKERISVVALPGSSANVSTSQLCLKNVEIP